MICIEFFSEFYNYNNVMLYLPNNALLLLGSSLVHQEAG